MAVPFWLKAAMVIVFAAAMFAVVRGVNWSADSFGVAGPLTIGIGITALAWFIERWRAKRGLPPL